MFLGLRFKREVDLADTRPNAKGAEIDPGYNAEARERRARAAAAAAAVVAPAEEEEEEEGQARDRVGSGRFFLRKGPRREVGRAGGIARAALARLRRRARTGRSN